MNLTRRPPAAFHPRRRALGFPSAPAAALGLLVLGLALIFPPAGRSAPPTVRLTAEEFRFTPKDVTVQPGDISFTVTNRGAIEHNLTVDTTGGGRVTQIAIIEPGETRSIVVSLPPGTYTVYCSLPGHREAGMVGTLKVNP
ncbi:MAG TPA: plastocyanin/azurin family copper-binding protein [bacterium]|nr:plastocyanin/azurin family copper-binding protein [bacterium]